ncbi:MFS transporter [Corynebacterium sp. HMSC29G08]|uniref:MFS transporter n=1 Tax=Corynebacterium sp. HMSC29G08 TaxID=1581069 RepID=UPI0008A1A328|nr:MFS transporter [Corynebacterium sp. HMSC29G08]OFT83673.1 cyanate permease [Corynebacterium sp. HMSC29G08]
MRPSKRRNTAALLSAPLLFAAVVAGAINLRAGIASVGPVLEEALASFGAGASQAGLITAMPGFLFALMGLSAVPIAMRLGLTRTIALGATCTFIGLAVRPWVGQMAVFIVLTGLVVAGIAVANVLLPAWIKQHGGRHVVALMTVYGALLGLSGAVGPLSALVFSGNGAWSWALVVWAVPAAVQVVVWTVVVAKLGNDAPQHNTNGAEHDHVLDVPLWRSRTARFLLLFFGLQSMNAYIQMGWLPQIYRDAGASATTGTVALALLGSLNVFGGLVMPILIARARTLTPFVVAFAVATAAGYLGLLLTDAHLPYLWAFLLGVGGFCFPTAIALIPARSRSHVVTAKLSGFVQPYGYLMAGAGPLLVGAAYDATGHWHGILIALVASAVLMGLVGIRATAATTIDDELAAAARN